MRDRIDRATTFQPSKPTTWIARWLKLNGLLLTHSCGNIHE